MGVNGKKARGKVVEMNTERQRGMLSRGKRKKSNAQPTIARKRKAKNLKRESTAQAWNMGRG